VGDEARAAELDYPLLEVVPSPSAVENSRGEIVAVVAPGVRPAWNWVSAAVPYLLREGTAAVVFPTIAPESASVREKAAAAVLESRLGGGSRRFRYLPGNVRSTSDYPAESCVIRREDYLAARAAGVDGERLVSWLAERGRRVVYTPDASVAERPRPLLWPHLRGTLDHARARGAVARGSRGRSLSRATLLALLPVGSAGLGVALVAFGSSRGRDAGIALLAGYGVAVTGSATLGALRFQSFQVGLLAAPALVATQAAYIAGFLRGLAGGR
jgi:hypothetical protein